MKKTLLLGLAVFSGSLWADTTHKLEQQWLVEGIRTPESVLYYQQGSGAFLFVSEIEGQPTEVDGKGGIAKVGVDGKILDQDWVRGLNAPKGMGVYQDNLYVTDITEVVVISISDGKVVQKIPVADSAFLNDIAVNKAGDVFVSDSQTGKVHRIRDGKVETYLSDIPSVNGLATVGDDLIIGNDKLWRADSNKKLHLVAEGFAAQIDGIEMTAAGEYLISCWVGLMYYVHKDGRVELLQDSREEKINTADIGYNPEQRVVYVPNFFKNSVTAYHVK
jgi:hypothetical protein